ncbi:SDR family oxidoreductase [Corynebacterium flavescens]|uniref:SDR family oxidoreductase n=1 Tax=Corynebacterium flavescens TaxID=28028 RepID=UPI002897CBEC|nr:SDR family oxidoreductase [Corynebacterium flavescens]
MSNEQPTILVTGASGHLGSLTVHALIERGLEPARIIAAGRNTEHLRPLAQLGVNTVRMDYDDPATVASAMEGAGTVILVSGSEIGKRIKQHQTVIDAAAEAGISKLVYTSVTQADTTSNPVAPEHKATEAALKASAVPFVIARNNWYTENYLPDVATARTTGTVLANAGLGKVASASRADYAAGLAAIALGEGFLGHTLELGGDEPWDYKELASAISTVIGREVEYRPVSTAELISALGEAGIDEALIGFSTALGEAIRAGDLAFSDGTLSRLIGRATTPLVEGLSAQA